MRILVSCWLLCLSFAAALARAGGGGGGGGGGHGGGSYSGSHSFGASGGGWHSSGSSGSGGDLSWLVLIALVLAAFIAYHWYSSNAIRARQEAAERLLATLAQEDSLWNLKRMTARVEEVFFKVQAAWTANNQDLARDCMSARLFKKHKGQTDNFLAQGRRNVLEAITLREVAIFSVSDHKHDARDSFSAQVSGAMVDYMVNRHGTIIAGNSNSTEDFTEIWKFTRVNNQWVLDQIIDSASLGAIERGVAYSHKMRQPGSANV